MTTKHPGAHQALTEKPKGKLFQVNVHGCWDGHHMIEAGSAAEARDLADALPVPEHVDFCDYTVEEVEEVPANAAR